MRRLLVEQPAIELVPCADCTSDRGSRAASHAPAAGAPSGADARAGRALAEVGGASLLRSVAV